MSERSIPPFPPSHYNPPKAAAAVLAASRARRDSEPRIDVVGRNERVVRGGKVLFYPAPNDTVRIVGLSEGDEWIAEFACRARDFSELYIRRMERHVAEKTGLRIAIVG